MKETNLVFFGNEKLATGIEDTEQIILNRLIKAGYNIEQVVTGKLTNLRPHKSKIAVLVAYGQIIPQNIIDEFPLGIINIHPSLLPIYRGSTPIEQAILDGVTKTGVSIMKLDAGMDEGPIFKQKTVHLIGTETKDELARKLQKLGAELLIEVLPEIIKGKKPRQQPHPDRASYTTRITKQQGNIDLSKSAELLEREIRAYAGWPKSRTTLSNIDVVITSVTVADYSGESGKIKVIDKKLVLFCGEKSLIINKLKPAGKKEMTAEGFIAGYLNN